MVSLATVYERVNAVPAFQHGWVQERSQARMNVRKKE